MRRKDYRLGFSTGLRNWPTGRTPKLEGDRPFERIVPLTEVIASSVGMSSGSVKVKRKYEELLSELGSELYIIREATIEEIEKRAGELIAAGIKI